ncbi:hypothetical protein [Thalassobacillus devorans]|uniref:hypothetical protein n=1 Tax=Thalassobacillus devorans TaxID=279813 RepID=UPI00048C540D|nr:hypothetical protein [Thalassobacillus devorans]
MSEEFKHHDKDRKDMGEIYRQTLIDYGDKVDISFLDPRNLLSIAAYFIKHIKAGNITSWEGFTHFFLHIKFNAVFINGRYLKDFNNYDKLIKEILYT